ncbi:tetratricopeptide repeat protein [Planctomycetota bacterium]
MGGVGKTVLALVLARQLVGRYPDAQVFVDLRGASVDEPLDPMEAMGRIIRAFQPDVRLPNDPQAMAGVYRSVLHGRRALIILDNALDDKQVRPLIPPDTCFLLITSRQRFVLEGFHAVDIEVLPTDDACLLLRKICPRIDKEAETLAGLCGRLPLALRAAASLLSVRDDMPVREYIKRLRKEETRLKHLGREGVDITVEASLALSYRLLPRRVRQKFCMLAVFHGAFHRDSAATVWRVEPEPAGDMLSTLRRFSLVEWAPDTDWYRLHDLVRLFAGPRLTAVNRHTAELGHAFLFCFILAQAGRFYAQGGEGVRKGLALFDQEWADIEAGHAWVVAHTGSLPEVKRLISLYPLAAFDCLLMRLHPHTLIAWVEPALAAARDLKDARAEIAHLNELGIAYDDLGEESRAIEYHNAALILARRSGNRRAEAGSLNELGSCYLEVGDMPKGIDALEQALVIDEELSDRRAQANTLGNLGHAYRDRREWERAAHCYQRQLQLAHEVGDLRGEASALCGLGSCQSHTKDIAAAADSYERALAIARDIGDRRLQAWVLGGLGGLCIDRGDARQASEHFAQELPLVRAMGDRRAELVALCNLASALRDLGELVGAIEHNLQALTLSQQLSDGEKEAEILSRLGTESLEAGRPQAALQHLEGALALFRELARRREQADTLGNMATACQALGDAPGCLAYLEQALAAFRELGDRASECQVLCQIGETLARLGRTASAVDAAEGALAIARDIGDKARQCHALSTLAQASCQSRDTRRAMEYCRLQLSLAQEIGDKDQEADALCGIGIIHSHLGDPYRAIEHYQLAANLHSEAGDLANKGNDLKNMAEEMDRLGLHDDATRCLQEALQALDQAQHPRAQEIRELLLRRTRFD